MKKKDKFSYNTTKTNLETGEVTDAEGVFISKEQSDAYRKIKKTQDEYGAFTWLLFNNTQELLPNVSPANITRLMYVSTFLGYNGYLLTANNKIMTKEGLQKQLKLSKNMFYNFWKEMLNENIFCEKDDKIYLNNTLFGKGSAKNINTDFTRLYVDGIRYIYENCEDAKQHKTLCYLFKVIPYINKQFNIITKNDINIKERDEIIPMTVPEFGGLVGIDNSHSRRLINILRTIQIDAEYAFVLVSYGDDTYMCINPHIYYAGSNWYTVQGIANWCIKKKVA